MQDNKKHILSDFVSASQQDRENDSFRTSGLTRREYKQEQNLRDILIEIKA